MVAALLSVAVYDYNAAVLIHLHGVLVMVLGLVLLDLVAVRRYVKSESVCVNAEAEKAALKKLDGVLDFIGGGRAHVMEWTPIDRRLPPHGEEGDE